MSMQEMQAFMSQGRKDVEAAKLTSQNAEEALIRKIADAHVKDDQILRDMATQMISAHQNIDNFDVIHLFKICGVKIDGNEIFKFQ